jgi:hypothetical protein
VGHKNAEITRKVYLHVLGDVITTTATDWSRPRADGVTGGNEDGRPLAGRPFFVRGSAQLCKAVRYG